MAGDDLTLGNLSVRGAATIGPSTFSITGIYAIRLSTYAPASLAGNASRNDSVTSSSFTFSTNDIAMFPQALNPNLGGGIGGIIPTSSGAIQITQLNLTTGAFVPSTGTYTIVVFRTT